MKDTSYSLIARTVKQSMLERFWHFKSAFGAQLGLVWQDPGNSLSCGQDLMQKFEEEATETWS